MHAVNEHVIIPITRTRGEAKSWALMLHPKGLQCDKGGRGSQQLTFVSHNWNEGVYEFCSKMLAYIFKCDLFWICFLANPQAWDSRDLSLLLGSEPWQSPFARTLKHADRFYVVPNASESVYKRLWCCYEIFIAVGLGL